MNYSLDDSRSMAERFFAGDGVHSYEYFGARLAVQDGRQGVLFRVWAPNANSVAVVGSFNDWNKTDHFMNKNRDGVWELFVEGVKPLDSYKRFGSSQYKKNTVKGFKIPNDPEDITGGYLLVLEKAFHYPELPNGLVTKRGISFIVKSPEFMSEKQAAYISGVIQSLEDAIYAKDGRDPKTGRHFTGIPAGRSIQELRRQPVQPVRDQARRQ